MNYNTIIIRKSSYLHPGIWVYHITEDPLERVSSDGILNPSLGFYHYPDYVPEYEAFAALKEAMLKHYQKRIDSLRKDMAALSKLTMEDKL